MRDGFVARHEWLGALQGISDAEGGRLFKALLAYSADGEKIKLNGREQLLFAVFAAEIDREREKARAKSEKARESVRKRWERYEIATSASPPRDDGDGAAGALADESTNECERIRTYTNECERIRTNGEHASRARGSIYNNLYAGGMNLNPVGNPGEDDDESSDYISGAGACAGAREDVLDSYRARAKYADAHARELIAQAWQEAFGRQPYPAVVDELVSKYGRANGGAGVEYVIGAIREAALRSAGDPVAYIHALMRDWYGEYENFS